MKNKNQKVPPRWNSYKYDPDLSTEINSGELLVVPDQSYTIPEIIEKFTRGISLNIMREASYSDTDDFDEVDERSMIKDYTDIQESVERIRERKERKSKKTSKGEDGLPDPNQPLKKAGDGSGVKDDPKDV